MPFHTLYPPPLKSKIFVLFSHIYCFSDTSSAIEYITYKLCLVNSAFATILVDGKNKIIEWISIDSYIEFRRVYRSFSLYNASFSTITINNRLFSNIIPFNQCPNGRRWGTCPCTPHCTCSPIFDRWNGNDHNNHCPNRGAKTARLNTLAIVPFRSRYHYDQCKRSDFDYLDTYSSESESVDTDNDSYYSAEIY